MSRIVVIGSLNMDMAVNTPKIPKLGETVLGSGFITSAGGKGANQAVAAVKLGGDVEMIGCVGDDIFGRVLVQNLTASHVKVENVKTITGCPTGTATIVIKGGDNFIIVSPGANFMLTPAMIEELEEVLKSSQMLVLQMEIPMDTIEKAIEIAKKHGVKVLLNPAPARKLSNELLSSVDILTPNENECEMITGLHIKNIEDAKQAVLYLNRKGVQQVIVTLGGNGVVYNDGESVMHKDVPNVKVVDTTAAGDSFTGAVAVALSQGKNIDSAVEFGNIVGTLTVMKSGAQASIPTLEDVYKFMENRSFKR